MKKLAFIGIIIFLLSFFTLAETARAQNYVKNFENGKIDWTSGIATATGIGAPPEKPVNMAQARAMAKRAAVIVARRNLLEIINGVRIDSHTIVKNFVVQSDVIRNQVEGYLQECQVVDIAYMSDGSVEATVTMKLRGRFANLMLPKEIKSIQPIEQTSKPPRKQGEAYTGLVVDSRGFHVKPAMSPKIVDEDGNEVYGSSYVSRDYAITQGMVGYAKNLTAAQTNKRVANNPLTIKGIRTADTGDSDIVISNADAANIKRAGENLTFLKKCRVMIVLD